LEIIMTRKTLFTFTVLAALMGATAASAQDNASVRASVSGALDRDTGFVHGGRVEVDGIGSAAMTVSRGEASIATQLSARASIDPISNVPMSSSEMITTMEYVRDVSTSASLIGPGRAVASGVSQGGIGVVGEVSSDASFSGLVDGGFATGAAPTSAQGGLSGGFSTRSEIVLSGTGDMFSQTQELAIGERNVGISAGRTGDILGTDREIAFDAMTFDTTGAPSVSGFGAGFASVSTLTRGSEIDMLIENPGQGSASVSGSTGGFFGVGTAFGATADPVFNVFNF
jgi:hypothetical protein